MRRIVLCMASVLGASLFAPGAQAMPNPSSQFCHDQGGRTEEVKDRSGAEPELCHLPDGRVVEAWSYFRQDADRPEKPHRVGGHGNPADVYCDEQGGQVQTVTNAKGDESSLCHLPDGTVEDTWSLFRRR